MANERTNTTNYTHPQETNLLNVHKAMEYDALGQPILRTTAGVSETSATIDAFARQRISNPYTIADYSHSYGQEPEYITVTSGSGTTTDLAADASIRLEVGTGNGDYVIHQTRLHHDYQPGKSQLIYMSFNFLGPRTNTLKRVGYYNEENGVIFQLNGDGTLSVIMRSDTSGSAVDVEIPQSDFNMDKLDGTGGSGFTFNSNKVHLLVIDFQWLGVGRVRLGLANDSGVIYFHTVHHTNTAETVYWSNPALPVRCEVRNTGTATGTAYLRQTCASVISEGGAPNTGSTHSINTPVRSPKVWTNGQIDKRTPIIAIRLKNSVNGRLNRGTVRLAGYTIQADSAPFLCTMWRLTSADRLSRSDSTAPTWTSASPDSIVEYSTDAQFVDLGNLDLSFELDSFFVSANNPSGKQSSGTSASEASAAKRDYIAQNFDSTDSQVFVLCATSLSTTASNVWGTITWREIR